VLYPYSISHIFQNDKRKHRTAVYVLIVTEECEDWHEGKCGKSTQMAVLKVTQNRAVQQGHTRHFDQFEVLKIPIRFLG
jgi:hypothetical protein